MSDRLMGFAFPFRITPPRPPLPPGPSVPRNGGVARATGLTKIEQNLRHLLGTRIGDRAMLRTYGGGAHALLHEPNDETTRTLLRHDLELALRQFLPEARLTAPLAVRVVNEQLTVAIEYVAAPGDVARRFTLELP